MNSGGEAVYLLSESDVSIIKVSLEAHLKQCQGFLEQDNQGSIFKKLERRKVEDKVNSIQTLLSNM